MLAVLSGGGTAGHINPALALADELAERGWDVRFAGTPTGVEARLVREAGIPFTPFEARGFNRSHPLTLPKALATIQKSTKLARAWFDEIRPDVVVGFGGYVCIPVARAAEQRGIPVVVHEQNSVMGMANKYLARRAAAVCLTYEHAAEALSEAERARTTVTGNPVRRSVFAATRAEGRAAFDVPDDALMLLVTGGSLGARHVNQAVAARKEMLLAHPGLHVVHVTGPKELDAVTEALALPPEEAARWRLLGYTDQMGPAMAAADAIVSRAGATSLAEIAARALPALLVPFPHATEDHQTMNARACVEAGAALMVADAEVDGPAFDEALRTLVEDADARERMAAAARAQKAEDAAALLADAVERAAALSS
ncbi:undecaprenyldiphospho-muramoylpentapeptide beta-N-acetylglucosaminyltransferase [Arabiibacter massiliensis]|uniref:undecaprenyldiphospho-muramoylpentapeptide beta-N-acetylglucosaminyltransferase n=1 Tax=Arabiibacter massiliensis TaxID=1870985 RepID=UPI0009BC25FA|nr:undecaprenyldiphospho-muramoylpentapeptide beta-N-acetylglucosaminyltransferase [Arabiibacter massiliensis]